MKLADWLHERRVSPEEFRRRLGLLSRSTVTRYLSGERKPKDELLRKIYFLTDGEVRPCDFDDASPPRCADVVCGPDGETRLIFPWTPGRDKLLLLGHRGKALLDDLPPPIARAVDTLGRRVVVIGEGLYKVDGVVRDTRGLVRLANDVLRSRGQPLIAYPGVHPPHPDRYVGDRPPWEDDPKGGSR